MASEEAGGGELMVEQPLRPHYDGGVVSGSARASAPSEEDATSTATSAVERYPINAILLDKDGDVKPATQAIEEGVTSSAEHAQSGGAPSEHSIREEHVQVHDEKEKDELEDVEMQDHVRARQIDTSTPADGLISHGSPGNQHRTAASASMSSASSSTLTSSSSSAINLSEPLSMSTLTKHTHSGAERTTSSIPSASEFVQKSDAANQVPKRQRIPRACDSCR